MNPNNLLVWPDGFWCLREEYCEDFLRDQDYRVVEVDSEEWKALKLAGLIARGGAILNAKALALARLTGRKWLERPLSAGV